MVPVKIPQGFQAKSKNFSLTCIAGIHLFLIKLFYPNSFKTWSTFYKKYLHFYNFFKNCTIKLERISFFDCAWINVGHSFFLSVKFYQEWKFLVLEHIFICLYIHKYSSQSLKTIFLLLLLKVRFKAEASSMQFFPLENFSKVDKLPFSA